MWQIGSGTSSMLQCTDVSTTKRRRIWSTAAFQSQTSPVVSDYVPHVVACCCWPYHVIDVAHSAVGHSQSPDTLSGTCFQTNSETPTVLSLHSDTHSRHSSSTSISVLQRIRGVTIMRYINLHFTYLLNYSDIFTNPTRKFWGSECRALRLLWIRAWVVMIWTP